MNDAAETLMQIEATPALLLEVIDVLGATSRVSGLGAVTRVLASAEPDATFTLEQFAELAVGAERELRARGHFGEAGQQLQWVQTRHRLLRAVSGALRRLNEGVELGDIWAARETRRPRYERDFNGDPTLLTLLAAILTFAAHQRGLSTLANLDGHKQPPRPWVFVSYSRRNRSRVERLHQALCERIEPQRVFMDVHSIWLSADWHTVMRNALRDTVLLVCWVSPAYFSSDYAQVELGLALAHGATVVPVYANTAPENCPEFLRRHQGVRFQRGNFSEIAVRIASSMEQVEATRGSRLRTD